MKKIVAVLLFAGWILSCNKDRENNDKEKHCLILAESAVPQVVKDSFAVKYDSAAVITWFQKDSIGYTAYFIKPVNTPTLATFSSAGYFISEESAIEHDGGHDDDSLDSLGHNIPKDSICTCEIPD